MEADTPGPSAEPSQKSKTPDEQIQDHCSGLKVYGIDLRFRVQDLRSTVAGFGFQDLGLEVAWLVFHVKPNMLLSNPQ